ncbi:MAG: LysM peptidoglycan-binding domain-containing protein [Candidatus Accumulibacter meliphilus]|uniref:LysM peptidoglycan-binding domain-containing protein n=1 Tax=Candidatus Accumulibacter meliphilus TaxID=2211374 RepID=A0A369XPZ8_9PROT|nr:MAG: LysM peptidoglycan-binding domain-containing protein [Candidatus Accumulibacter meliphilus]
MELAKIEVTPLDNRGGRVEGKKFKVLFNPNSYSITKTVAWNSIGSSGPAITRTNGKVNAPTLFFAGGGSRLLNLELFYDVTEPVNDVASDDVRKETNKVVELTRIQKDLQRPPAVEIAWGAAPPARSDFPFTGVVSNLVQRFTLFSSDGRPLRATLTITVTEFLDPVLDQRQTDPEFTTRRIKRGDTLSAIAAENYRDPSLWRVIAEANQLDDPRDLRIGRTLTIPKRG